MFFREINFSVIGRYVDYLVEEQGVKNVFGKSSLGISLHISSSVLGKQITGLEVTVLLCYRLWLSLAKQYKICEFLGSSILDLKDDQEII